MKVQFLVASAAISFSLLASDTVSPVAVSGGGDLSQPATWGGTPPSSDSHVGFRAGVYTLSSDSLTVGSVSMRDWNVTFDFRSEPTEPVKTITLTKLCAGFGEFKSVFQYDYQDSKPQVLFRGGKWDCSRLQFDFVPFGSSTYYSSGYATAVLTNGCEITNVGGCNCAARICNSKVIVSDKSKLSVSGTLRLGYVGGTNNVLEACSGSTISASGLVRTDTSGGAPGHSGHYIDIHDEGTVFKVTGSERIDIGYDLCGNGLRVRDSAEFSAGSIDIILGRAAYSSGGNVFAPSNNWIDVLNGAALTAKNIKCQGSFERILVSDARMTLNSYLSLGESAKDGHDNRLTVTGAQAVFKSLESSDYDPFGNAGHHNTIVLSDGAQWRREGNSRFCFSSNNVFRVNGEGTLFDAAYHIVGTTNNYVFSIGNSDSAATLASCRENVLEISDGAEFRADHFFVHGVGHQVVVSNGTLTTGSIFGENGDQGYSIWMGRSSSSGQKLILKGACPKIRAQYPERARALMLAAGTTLRYEIPADGYVPGHVVIEQKEVYPTSGYVGSNEKLEIVCEEWAANANEKPSECILFRNPRGDLNEGTKSWFADQVAQMDLPKNVKLLFRGSDVILRRSSNQGIVIIFK